MAQSTLTATKDVHINSDAATTNQNGAGFLDVGEATSATTIRRALIQFDLTSLPVGAEITSATLKLYDSGTDLTNNARTMNVYRSKRAWGETTATWNTYDGSNNWSTAGALYDTNDFETSAIGSIVMPNPPVEGYVEITLTASAVQDWIDGDFTNNGIGVGMATESDDLHRFQTRTQANPPQLVVEYTAPSGNAVMFGANF